MSSAMNLTQETSTEERKTQFPPLPKDDYKVKLVNFEVADNSKGTGTNGKARFEIVNGEFRGRILFHNFILQHTSVKAQEIGRKQIASILVAADSEITNVDDLGEDFTQIMDLVSVGPAIIARVDYKPEQKYTQNGVEKTAKEGNKITSFTSR